MFDPAQYQISAKLFIQLLGAIYFFAFGAFIFQIKGLLGQEGILPIKNFLAYLKPRLGKKKFFFIPSLFWINDEDRTLLGLVWAGTLISLLLFFNIYPSLMLFLLYFLYLSIVSTGQDFLSFGWEMFLLELTAQAFFLSLTAIPNIFIWVSLNFQLFRFHFQGGIVKIFSRDPNWRNLTAVAYHYQSQPLPTALAWYMHKLPLWFHKLSTLIMFIIELAVPFAIFVDNQEVRLVVFFCLFGLQFFIWSIGNFSFLNHMTAVFCILLVSDKYLQPIFGPPPQHLPTPLAVEILVSLAGLTFIVLQAMNFWHHVIRRVDLFNKILNFIQPFHLANRYGIFAVMTTRREEIVIEGSDDGSNWKEYSFRFKPSELNRRPRRNSPFQPRIDWQAWFLPFRYSEDEGWFQHLLYHLLKGSVSVLKLFRVNPFSEKPPLYIRAQLYEYKFSSWEEKKKDGVWWTREFVRPFSPTIMLKN